VAHRVNTFEERRTTTASRLHWSNHFLLGSFETFLAA
jgi:hypothetical protein